MNNTTRRYPRTMLEAWPTHYPYAIERTKPTSLMFKEAFLIAFVLSIPFVIYFLEM